MMGKRVKRLCILAAVGAVLLTAGCKSAKPDSHKQSVNAANQRWLTMRSTLMLQMAQQQFDTGDLDQAEKTLVEAIGIDPKNAKLHVLAGRVGLERGQLERAYNRLDTAKELDPKLADAHYFQGIVLQRWQRHEQALESYRKAYECQADNPTFLIAIAEMLVATNRVDEAVTTLTEKVTYFDQSAMLRVTLGQLHAMRREFPQAVNYLRQAQILRPDDLRIAEELAHVQLAAGEMEEAIRTLERLCADKSRADRRDLQVALANAYRLSGRHADAKAAYLKLTHSDPRDADAWLQLAELAWSQEDSSGTLVAANRVIALAPQRPDGYLLAGLVWQSRQRWDEALRMFDRAAELSPGSSEALILRGITLERANKPAAAAQAYDEALRRRPEDARAQSLLANVSANHEVR